MAFFHFFFLSGILRRAVGFTHRSKLMVSDLFFTTIICPSGRGTHVFLVTQSFFGVPRTTCTSPFEMVISGQKGSSIEVSFPEFDSEFPSSQFITGVVDVGVSRIAVMGAGVFLLNSFSGLGVASFRKSCSCA